jgi:hypothetical protein
MEKQIILRLELLVLSQDTSLVGFRLKCREIVQHSHMFVIAARFPELHFFGVSAYFQEVCA